MRRRLELPPQHSQDSQHCRARDEDPDRLTHPSHPVRCQSQSGPLRRSDRFNFTKPDTKRCEPS